MPERPRIALISTGGTIDSVGSSRLDLAWYYEAKTRLADGELVASMKELEDLALIDQVPFRRLSSYALTTDDWLDLARMVGSLLNGSDHDGVVITHGTNTLEETALFLHLTLCSSKPVVLVGAMRPASALSADGYLNLLHAVQVASALDARDQGVLVVMNDAIFAARDVTKTSTYRVDAFRAPDLGPLGYTDADGRTIFYHRHLRLPVGRPYFDLDLVDHLPRVDVVTSYVGADGVAIDAVLAAGARGIVTAGTGAGRPTPAESEALKRAMDSGVVVCHSSRVGSGRVARSPLSPNPNAIAADNLQPWKAKVLLSLALTRTNDANEIQALFDHL